MKPQESSGTSVQINVDLAEFLPSAPRKVRSMIRRRSFGVKEEEKRTNMKTFVSWLVVSRYRRYIEIDLLPMSVVMKMCALHTFQHFISLSLSQKSGTPDFQLVGKGVDNMVNLNPANLKLLAQSDGTAASATPTGATPPPLPCPVKDMNCNLTR